jgi:DNA-binding NarL/FixJ family response regulator
MKILLIEDHSIVRYGVARMLTNMAPDVSIDEFADFNEALKRMGKEQYALAILDINIPNGNNLQMIQLMRLRQTDIKILVFSGLDEKMYALRYIREGADGYLMKNSPNQEMTDAVRCILNNEKYISPNIRRQLLQNAHHGLHAADNPLSTLSDREMEVMQYLLQGHSIGAIARSMNLHISTVSTYKMKVFQKLEVTNVVDLGEKKRMFS